MKIEPAMVRTFFEIEAERGHWQVEHLEPQIHMQPRGVVGLLGKAVRRDGAILVSDALDPEARAVLGLDRPLYVRGLADGHRAYLPWHRERVFNTRPEADRQGKLPTAPPHACTLAPEGT